MTTLKDVRASLTGTLQDLGAPVYGFLPDRFVPPVAVLVQGNPYVDQGDTFGVSAIRYQLVLIAGNGTNEVVTTSLDNLIEAAYGLVNASDDFLIEGIDQPALYKHGTGTYLSCVVSIVTNTRLGE